MNRYSKSILQEITDFVPIQNKENFVESKAEHAISSAISLITLLESEYGPKEADYLIRRFFSSIRGRDSKRFSRSIQKIREASNDGDR